LIIMPANNTHWLVHFWAGLYGNVGHLYSPDRRTVPMPHIPYVLDNGAWAAWSNGTVWSERDFLAHVEYYAFNALRPEWLVVPDAVADSKLTLARFDHWAPRLIREYHLEGRVAIAVQDGMKPADVRALDIRPSVVCVGGTTDWKWATAADWASSFERVHILRVNTGDQLARCLEMGVESVDGTGYFRGDPKQLRDLGYVLASQAGRDPSEVDRMVHFSRLKVMGQPAMPLEAAS
jgi:hypothetical protein